MARTKEQIINEEKDQKQNNDKKDARTNKQGEIKSVYSKRLKIARENKGVKHNKVANDLGFQPNAIKQYEEANVEPSLSAAKILADYYNVSLDWLCGKNDLSSEITPWSSYHIAESFLAIIDRFNPDIKYDDKSPDVTFSFKFDDYYMEKKYCLRDFIEAYLSLNKMVNIVNGSYEDFNEFYIKLLKDYEDKL